jgi:hypothetical protein
MTSSRIVGAALCLAFVALLGPGQAYGQFESGQWRATPVLGINTYDDATPFQTAAMIGGTVQYSVAPAITLGLGMGFARPEVDGSYFPRALFVLSADTTFLFNVGYQASQWTYYGMLTVGAPLGNWYVYGSGGVGGVTFWYDRQSFRNVVQKTDRTAVTNLMFPLGVGISYSVSELIGVRIDVTDEIYTSFDRDELNPIAEARFENTCQIENFCIQDANGTVPEPKSTVHNFRFSIGFEFTPGR